MYRHEVSGAGSNSHWHLLSHPDSPIAYTTVRGGHAIFQGTGLYRYDPAWFALEGIVWDVINLFVGLSLFAVAII